MTTRTELLAMFGELGLDTGLGTFTTLMNQVCASLARGDVQFGFRLPMKSHEYDYTGDETVSILLELSNIIEVHTVQAKRLREIGLDPHKISEVTKRFIS